MGREGTFVVTPHPGSLPAGYGPHQLSGEWKGVSECHIDSDWLLIYDVTPEKYC